MKFTAFIAVLYATLAALTCETFYPVSAQPDHVVMRKPSNFAPTRSKSIYKRKSTVDGRKYFTDNRKLRKNQLKYLMKEYNEPFPQCQEASTFINKDVPLRIATWNIFMFKQMQVSQLNKIARCKDVLILQEVLTKKLKETKETLKRSGLPYSAQCCTNLRVCNMVASKYPISKSRAQNFSKLGLRCYIQTTIDLPSRQIQVIGTHLTHISHDAQKKKGIVSNVKGRFKNEEVQRNELAQLNVLGQDTSLFTILGGDFNAGYNSVHKTLTNFISAIKPEYRRVFTFNKKRIPAFTSSSGQVIDHIFVNRPSRGNVKIVRTAGSDHYPLIGSLRLPTTFSRKGGIRRQPRKLESRTGSDVGMNQRHSTEEKSFDNDQTGVTVPQVTLRSGRPDYVRNRSNRHGYYGN